MDYVLAASQSPYGAKWFATVVVVYNGGVDIAASQSPYGAKWFATPPGRGGGPGAHPRPSQSPYGAKWFATGNDPLRLPKQVLVVAIPLRG